MQVYEGQVVEIQLQGGLAAWIACPRQAIPAPGRYVMAWSPEETQAPLATPLFASQSEAHGFLAAPPVPTAWQPGTRLMLRGPCGTGFHLPAEARRLALAAFGKTTARLLPLIGEALQRQAAVALFSPALPAGLPSAVEINPLSALPESLAWADFLALDLAAEQVTQLGQALGMRDSRMPLPCPGQALVLTDMPCGGLADCGACAMETRRGWKLACADGPVFDLGELIL